MTAILFENAEILDGTAEGRVPGHVLVEGGRIAEVSDRPIVAASARRVDLRGATLMPGLIDAHVHVIATIVNLAQNALLPDALVAHRAAHIMGAMLARGFTTIRDLGGATEGLRAARNEGLFPAPRMVLCGHQAARSPRQPGAVAMSTLMRSRGTQGAAPARRGRSRSARFLMAISWTWKAAS